jgi:polysaccharide pyruvyl transferase WcaK-like protein
MSLQKLKVFEATEPYPMYIDSGVCGAKLLIHIGVHNSANRNAGDTLLFSVVRRAFDTIIGPFNWELQQAWSEFTPEVAERINTTADGIVLGGGGLLLRDQEGSDVSNSGWQWNSSISAVDVINIPLIIFAIGYNRFRGQKEFDPIFTQHIRKVAEKARFFGLRNNGSINAVSDYLSPDTTINLRHQFCPTTVIWQLYPEYRTVVGDHVKLNKKIFSFNAAFDRTEHRFGENLHEVLSSLAKAVQVPEKRGWSIIVTAHKKMDRDIEPYLDDAGVNFNTVDLTGANPDEIMNFYANVDFAFGMRGHAQMIPFGLRRPIMSIISHDKMRYFLDDIGKPEWGVEINSPDIIQRLDQALENLENDKNTCFIDIENAQNTVWEATRTNILNIGKGLT